jgi:MoaA/NifB/PqqE/SkfB family radical SAM enzyme
LVGARFQLAVGAWQKFQRVFFRRFSREQEQAVKKLLTTANLKKALARPSLASGYLKGKLKAALGYRFGNGYSFMPGRIFFVLTGRCNLNCKMCPQNNNPLFHDVMTKETELNIEELRRMIDEISTFHPRILVTGGELSLHSAFFDFLSYIKKAGLFCGIVTNGIFLERDAAKLVSIGLDEISVSLDGPEAVHDGIRGVPGTYAKAVKGMKRIAEERKKIGAKVPMVNINFTISAANFRYVFPMVELMSSLNIDMLQFTHLQFLTPKDFEQQMALFKNLFGIEQDTSWQGLVSDLYQLDAEYLADTIEQIRNRKVEQGRITFSPDFNKQDIIRYYSDKPFHSQSLKGACLSPWDFAILGPAGEVVLCPNYIIGNLREHSFRETWNSPKARFFRKIILKKKSLPACSRGCCFFYL